MPSALLLYQTTSVLSTDCKEKSLLAIKTIKMPKKRENRSESQKTFRPIHLVHPTRFELATLRIGIWYSIQLSYGCLFSLLFARSFFVSVFLSPLAMTVMWHWQPSYGCLCPCFYTRTFAYILLFFFPRSILVIWYWQLCYGRLYPCFFSQGVVAFAKA